ncbi:M48 family metallopeptidase [Allosphingosinicella flava]|nr:SprT family zinc-dependent metalloprotease [Sphingosinicella flava]
MTLKVSARAKAMRLRVDSRTGAVVLTVPKRISARRALAWAATQADWIARTQAAVPPAMPLVPGAPIPFRGIEHRIFWDPRLARTPCAEEGVIRLGGPEDAVEARLLRWLRRQALDILTADTALFARRAGVTVGRVGTGDTVSRWGSCSASGDIRYSWRLILAPDWVRQATAAHEVAHRVHMNHGPAFHALVAEIFGADPSPAREWLRRNGAALHRVGRT